MAQKKNNGTVVAIIAMMFLFAMISFVTNMAAPFGTIWKNQYDWAGMVGNLMNFAAYLFMGWNDDYKDWLQEDSLGGSCPGFHRHCSTVLLQFDGCICNKCLCGLSAGCVHLRFLRVHPEYGSESHAQLAGWRRKPR